MQLLTTRSEIRAAIAMLNPVARDAAQSLSNHLLANSHIFHNSDELQQSFIQHCAFAMQQNGWDLNDETKIQKFFEEHGESVVNLCMSIVVFAVKEEERKRKWGWLGKAVAVGAGIIIGSLFS